MENWIREGWKTFKSIVVAGMEGVKKLRKYYQTIKQLMSVLVVAATCY
jgi:hypothetical protein